MNIIKDKDAIWYTDNYDVILVGTSIYCMLSNGFQCKVKNKYRYIDKANDETNYGDLRKLGKRLTIKEDGKPIICLMYICNYPNRNRVSIDYNALENAMSTANIEFSGKKVMTTVLGSSFFDGNGDKEKILKIMENNSDKMDLDVYDYEQLYITKEKSALFKEMKKYKKTDPEKYKKIGLHLREILEKFYLQ